MRIGIDIDNTIACTSEALYPYFEEYRKEKNIDSKYLLSKNRYQKIINLEDKEYNDFILKYLELASYNAKVKEYAVWVLKEMYLNNYIVFVTSRSSEYYSDPYTITYSWLIYMDIPFDKLIVSVKDKGIVAKNEKLDIFIDDSISNCRDVYKKKVEVLLFDSIFNKNYTEFKRAKNWKQIYNYLRKKDSYDRGK